MTQTPAPEASTIETLIPGSPEYNREMAHVGAIHILAMSRVACPELVRAEASARLDLVAAILAFDEIEEKIAAGEKLHSMQQQVNVELAQKAHLLALMNLIRRESQV